ncbi:MAG TPA: RNA methyltransferase [Clostridiaceae bacterium]|nr:RNA methyltransferase [Clostridiaceae bacterium]
MRVIESADNSLFKMFQRLKSPHQAKKEKLVIVEGLRHVADLIANDIEPDYLVFSNDARGELAMQRLDEKLEVDLSSVLQDKVCRLAPHLFERISDMKTHQGVFAIVRPPSVTLEELLESFDYSTVRFLLLEDVQDPGNVGTLIRSADALGFHGVLLTDSSATIYNPKTVAASMGSIFHLPIVELQCDIGQFACDMKRQEFILVASNITGDNLASGRPQAPKLILMMGNEGKGLSKEALQLADLSVMIPMSGKAESLNVASAGAILMWEIVRGERRLEYV